MERANSNQTRKRKVSSNKRFGGMSKKNKGIGSISSMILMNGGNWGWSFIPDKDTRHSYIAQVKAARKRREILKRKPH